MPGRSKGWMAVLVLALCLLGRVAATLAQSPDAPKEKTPPVDPPAAGVKPLTEEQQAKLLGRRINGGLGLRFGPFANMFLVAGRLKLGYGVGLMTSSKEIAQSELQSPFPEFYEPTLRELLDAIALQTSSQWKYDSTDRYIRRDEKSDKPIEGIAIFEFTKREKERPKPYQIKLAAGWKAVDRGNWVMHVPPTFPVGMDIYELGRYTADDKQDEPELFKKVAAEAALEWAQRVREAAVK